MRTTISLDTDIYRLARAIAAQRKQSLGRVLGDALREQLTPSNEPTELMTIDEFGWPTLHVGQVVTSETVRRFLEEE